MSVTVMSMVTVNALVTVVASVTVASMTVMSRRPNSNARIKHRQRIVCNSQPTSIG